ncbi:hypothetical protein [Blautia wexlerae]|uniref:hypothetical protein n=1 Tax=Blautia wexlerae TaxID=418240 RepID=UPI001FB965E0|nr:hypothetical protein [Blautia wexlerae]NSG64271.1 hypothetical protein [Blautia wexlerae]
MREERYHIALDKYDKNIVINALNTLRTRQLQEERPTEPVDELISKVAHAPTKKVRYFGISSFSINSMMFPAV